MLIWIVTIQLLINECLRKWMMKNKMSRPWNKLSEISFGFRYGHEKEISPFLPISTKFETKVSIHRLLLSFGEIIFRMGFVESANLNPFVNKAHRWFFGRWVPVTAHTIQMWSKQQKHKILVNGCCSFKWSTSTLPVSTENYFELGRLLDWQLTPSQFGWLFLSFF